MSKRTRLAFVGGGNMGRALVGALLRGGYPAADLRISDAHEATRTALQRDFPGVHVSADNLAAIAGARVVVLAVKPQEMAAVVGALRPTLQQNRPVVLSIAAGLTVRRPRPLVRPRRASGARDAEPSGPGGRRSHRSVRRAGGRCDGPRARRRN